jgi:hypothetical protein
VTATDEYINNGDGTVTQHKPQSSTKLMWQQEDDGVLRSWDAATAYCAGLSLGKYSSGWKLPTNANLNGLVDKSQLPTINGKYFKNTKKSIYWTSSAAGGAYLVYYVDFSDGSYSYITKNTYDQYARCVHSVPATL